MAESAKDFRGGKAKHSSLLPTTNNTKHQDTSTHAAGAKSPVSKKKKQKTRARASTSAKSDQGTSCGHSLRSRYQANSGLTGSSTDSISAASSHVESDSDTYNSTVTDTDTDTEYQGAGRSPSKGKQTRKRSHVDTKQVESKRSRKREKDREERGGRRASLRSNQSASLVEGLIPVKRTRSSSSKSTTTAPHKSRARHTSPGNSKSKTAHRSATASTSKKSAVSASSGAATRASSSRGKALASSDTSDSPSPVRRKKSKRSSSSSRQKHSAVAESETSKVGSSESKSRGSSESKSRGKVKSRKKEESEAGSSAAARTTGSCASSRRRASVVVGKQTAGSSSSATSAPAPAASSSSSSAQPPQPSAAVSASSGLSSALRSFVAMSEQQDIGQSAAGASSASANGAAARTDGTEAAAAAAGLDGSAAAAAAAAASSPFGTFASLLPGMDQDGSEAGHLQALLEARGLPSHLFGALGPRMHQLLHRSMIGGSVSKAQQLLQNLQSSKEESQQLSAVIEMCQLLVMGNEDTLAGFPIKQVVPALIALLHMEHNFDMMHHACRALTYMMEALPRSSAVVVDAVPVLLEKLQAIHCMDVAEQSLQALEMLSKKHNKAILHANGMLACLTYVDFFSLPAQRCALSIAANCCQNLSPDEFHFVKDALPLITARLNQSDKKSLDSVCLCMARLVDNYQSDEKTLQEIASHGLLASIQNLLVMTPPLISSGMFVSVLHMLVVMCTNCPDLAVQLLKRNVAETLCFLLVGPSDQGAAQCIELVQRTPQELYEIVCLIGELMPNLPTDGLFAVDGMLRKHPTHQTDKVAWQWLGDHGIWHWYSLMDSRIIEAAHAGGEHEVSLTIFGGNYTIDFDMMQQINDDTGTARHVQRKVNFLVAPKQFLVKSDSREDILNEDSNIAAAFIKTLFSVLYEVYNSSAGPAVRHKCLQAILRMMYYSSPELLNSVLPSCNVSSHIAAMMASQDLKIVVAGIQMANILMEKLPQVFSVYFCREGVIHQIKKLCEPEAIDLSTKKDQTDSSKSTPVTGGPTGSRPTPTLSASSPAGDHPPSTAPAGSSTHLTKKQQASAMVAMMSGAQQTSPTDPSADKSAASSSSRLRLSSVLKHKKQPKRSSTSGSGRKSSKLDSAGGGSLDGGVGEHSLHPAQRLPGSSGMGEMGAGLQQHPPPHGTRSGKWSSSMKASFLAGLHPSRWGRSSSTGDRPSPPLAGGVGLSHILYQEAVRTPPLPPRPSPVDNREKIRQWVSDQAVKFNEKYFSSESRTSNSVALSSLNQLCSATNALSNQNEEMRGLREICEAVLSSDMSPFEMLHSGLVEAVLTYLTTAGSHSTVSSPAHLNNNRNARLRRFLTVFLSSPSSNKVEPDSSWTLDVSNTEPFSSLVSKLMNCFHHLEQVKVHDLPGSSGPPGSRGSSALRFFDTHQLKCNLQRHSSCTSLKQWRGGAVKIDPLALVQAIERYLIMRGYGRVRSNADNDCSDDDDGSDDDIDDTMAAVSLSHGSGRHRLEFLIGNHVLPYNMTVYEAVKQFSDAANCDTSETDTDAENPYGNTGIWINTHTIWFRPAPDHHDHSTDSAVSPKKTKSDKSRRHLSKSAKVDDGDGAVVAVSPLEEFLSSTLPLSVTVKDPSLQVLTLLRVLHGLNRHWFTLYEAVNCQPLVSSQEFISCKLTAKANRQLQDPLIIMTGNMPQWLVQIGRACPFLLPFDTRLSLFYATSFDRERAMMRLQDSSHEQGSSDTSDRVAPRLERKKSVVCRDDILKQAEKVINDLGSSKAILEVQYENEVGTGLGPTLEFYALVSREIQRADLDLWRGDHIKHSVPKEGGEDGTLYAFSPHGLYPLPVGRGTKAAHINKIKAKFRFLGKFMGKALMDSRMLDVSLSEPFYKWMLGQESSLGPNDLSLINPSFSSSFSKLLQLQREKKHIDLDKSHTSESRQMAVESVTMDGCSVEDLDLDFILPGHPNIELKKGGKDIPVTLDNLDEYIKLVTDWMLVEGTHRQFEAFREGFETFIQLSSLSLFYPEEMEQLFCGNTYETWTVRYLLESCRLDHGYTADSQSIKFLFEILCSYVPDEQRRFMQFMTGSPRLPVGGLKSLNPPLTIVRKAVESNENPDHFLPSVMTCVNYLKLPDYSCIEVMREKLSVAALEGQLSFHLS